MVKVLSEHFITGACHAPVDSRQMEKVLWHTTDGHLRQKMSIRQECI